MLCFIQVVPPKEWCPRKDPLRGDLENIGDHVIEAPIAQNYMCHNPKSFQVVNVQKKKMTVREYQKYAVDE